MTEDRSQPPPSRRTAAIREEVAALGPPPSVIPIRLAPVPAGWDPADSTTHPTLRADDSPVGRMARAAWHLERAAGHLDHVGSAHRAPGAAAVAHVTRGIADSLPGIPLDEADLPPQTQRALEHNGPSTARSGW